MKKIIASIVLAFSLCGCIHRVGGGRVTPYETVMTWNDALAQSNNAIAKGIIAISPSVIPPSQAGAVLRHQRDIASIDEQLTGILKEGPEYAKLNAAQIQSLVDQLSAVAAEFVADGSIGVKNPKTQNTFQTDIGNISTLVSQIVGGLKTAGVLQ